MVGKINELPTLPQAVYKIIQVINNPNASVGQVAAALSEDMSLSLRVLRLANSGYYAVPGGVTSIDRAVTALGLDSVSQLVFTAAVFTQLDLQSTHAFKIREFWKHSLGVAIASEKIAREIGNRDTALIYLSGLCHDVGKLIYYQLKRDDWIRICEYARLENITIDEAEKVLNVVPHNELGFALMKRWQLPLMIQEVVLNHHDNQALTNQMEVSIHAGAVGIVNLANLLTHSMKYGSSGHASIRNPSRELVKRLLGNEAVLLQVARSVRMSLDRVEPLLNSIVGPEAVA